MSNNKDNVIKFVQPPKARELPEVAYAPESIGANIVKFFQQHELGRDEGLYILRGMTVFIKEGTVHDSGVVAEVIDSYITSFTHHVATTEEVLAGVEWVVGSIPAVDKVVAESIIAGEKGEGDGKKLH